MIGNKPVSFGANFNVSFFIPLSCFVSRVSPRTSHVTRHTSYVIRHMSHVTRHTSHVTRHTSKIRQVLDRADAKPSNMSVLDR